MKRQERMKAYRRLKRVRSDIHVTVRKISRSHGWNVDALERHVLRLSKRKRRLKKRFALLKRSASKGDEAKASKRH